MKLDALRVTTRVGLRASRPAVSPVIEQYPIAIGILHVDDGKPHSMSRFNQPDQIAEWIPQTRDFHARWRAWIFHHVEHNQSSAVWVDSLCQRCKERQFIRPPVHSAAVPIPTFAFLLFASLVLFGTGSTDLGKSPSLYRDAFHDLFLVAAAPVGADGGLVALRQLVGQSPLEHEKRLSRIPGVDNFLGLSGGQELEPQKSGVRVPGSAINTKGLVK